MERFTRCVRRAINYRLRDRLSVQEAGERASTDLGYDKRMDGFITILVLHMDETLRWFQVLERMALEEEKERPGKMASFLENLIAIGDESSHRHNPLDILGLGGKTNEDEES